MIEKSLIKKAQHETWQTDDYILERFKNYQKGGGTMDLDEFKELYFGDWWKDEQAAAASNKRYAKQAQINLQVFLQLLNIRHRTLESVDLATAHLNSNL